MLFFTHIEREKKLYQILIRFFRLDPNNWYEYIESRMPKRAYPVINGIPAEYQVGAGPYFVGMDPDPVFFLVAPDPVGCFLL